MVRTEGAPHGDRDLDAELVRLVGLAIADAFDLRSVQGEELPVALMLALVSHLFGPRQRRGEDLLQPVVAGDLTPDVAHQPAQPGAQKAQFSVTALELLGVGIAPGHHGRSLGHPNIELAQRHAMPSGQLAEHDHRLVHQPGVGRVSDVLRLHRGVHGDPGHILGLQGAGLVDHPQALGQQQIELVAAANASGPSARAETGVERTPRR